ncbi:hypothetical protein C8J57DRAFT_1538201 [Mycena rebaudengoi]|nr:hypothetical protein C8J57DRAFT_1538201 [Mycena rebaudengoi]
MTEPLRLACLAALSAFQAPIVCSLLALARRLSPAPLLAHLAARPFVYPPLPISLFVVERHPSAARQFSRRSYPSFPFASHAVDFTLPFIRCSFAVRYPCASRIALSCSAPAAAVHDRPPTALRPSFEQRFSLTRSYFATPGFATKTRFNAASRYRVVPACYPHVTFWLLSPFHARRRRFHEPTPPLLHRKVPVSHPMAPFHACGSQCGYDGVHLTSLYTYAAMRLMASLHACSAPTPVHMRPPPPPATAPVRARLRVRARFRPRHSARARSLPPPPPPQRPCALASAPASA